jgi:purine nucleoside permease
MRRTMKTLAAGLLTAALLLTSPLASAPAAKAAPDTSAPFDVKVLVITMFDPETKPWLDREKITRTYTVKGAYSPVWCTEEGVCVLTTGIGKSNAGLTTTAVLADPQFDFSRTIFMTAGIAGTPPTVGTLGAAAWADHVVDFDLGHHVLPEGDRSPDDLYIYRDNYMGTELYTLNHDLVSLAYDVTKGTELIDGDAAKAYRAYYAGQKDRKPAVLRCDTVSGDNYWHGKELSALASDMVKRRTNGTGTYCTTQMEDNATAGALARLGYLDRYLSLRTMSNFDQPHASQSVRESLKERSGGFPLAIENEYRVGKAFVNYLLAHRDEVLAKTAAPLTERALSVKVGAKALATKGAIANGRSLINGAALAEALGATYTWVPQTRTAKIEKDGKVLELTTDRAVARLGGQEVKLEVGARFSEGQVLLPVRYVAESLGFQVTWDEAAKAVVLK